jgi:hypothetical protein
MNRHLLFPLVLFVATGCSAPPNQVVPFRDGVLRALTYVQATDYCSERKATPKWLGRAPAESGVLFQCVAD